MSQISAFIAASALTLASSASFSSPQFQDVTSAAHVGGTHNESWGMSVVDINNDLYPDFFNPNHRNRSLFYRNNRDGTFSEVSKQIDVSKTPGWTGGRATVDDHGSAWGDFDNDGDQDAVLAISEEPDFFWRNDGGLLTNISSTEWSGTIYHWADRQPLFFDFTGDGKLDLFFASLYVTSLLRQKSDGTFGGGVGDTFLVGCNGYEGSFAHLMDLSPAPGLELLCAPRNGVYPASVMAFPGGIPTELSNAVPQRNRVADIATGDFDGNGLPDIIEVISTQRPSDATLVNSLRVEAQMMQAGAIAKTMTFRTTGVLTVTADTSAGDCTTQGCPSSIDIGSGRYHPADLTFTLDPANPANSGAPADGQGLNVWYNPATQVWTFEAVGGSSDYTYTFFGVSSTQTISNLTFQGSSTSDTPDRPVLLLNNGGGSWTDASVTGGFAPILCSTVVAGDFDNDMDEDIYFGCTGGSRNAPNILYENLGNGTFQAVANAGGAAGPTGPAYAQGAGVGTTETISTADYNLDGFLDMFVTNGNNMRPQYYGGPPQLYRNVGNGNRWLELDLQGVTSNRDGIGSVIRITAGGKTQYREMNGAYHRWGHSFKRIHVGLGSNTSATVQVTWPNGSIDTYNNVAANGLYRATQGGAITLLAGTVDSDNDGLTDAQEAGLGTNPNDPDSDDGGVNDGAEVANGTNPLNPTDDFPPPVSVVCGAPSINNATDRATFLWKDCNGSEQWHLRSAGGGSTTQITFLGTIDASGGLTSLQNVSIEATDVLDTTSNPSQLSYQLRVSNAGQDGFNFQVPANACFTPRGPATLPVYLGSARTVLATANLNLTTEVACVAEPDSDDDGLTDADEVARGTNPNDADSDDGGVNDGDEVAMGTNPLDGSDDHSITANDFCGQPTISGPNDRATFLWKNCTTDQSWHLRSSGGGSATELVFTGSIVVPGSGVTNLVPVSIEATDVLDTTTNPGQLSYSLRIYNNGQDGFDFQAAADACFSPQGPAGLPLYLGSTRRTVATPATINLSTGKSCGL